MKKFISLLALVSVFAACQKEDISTAFKVDPGVVTIRCTAKAITGENITSNTTFTCPGWTFSNGVATKTTESAINEEITVNAEWKGFDGARSFTASQGPIKVSVLPGGSTNIDLIFVLGEYTHGDYVYSVAIFEDYDASESTFFFLDKAHNAGHQGTALTHDGEEIPGAYFVHNLSEFILRGTVDYTEIEGLVDDGDGLVWKVTDVIDETKERLENEYYELLENDPLVENAKTFEIKVSAFAQYCAFHKVSVAPVTYSVYRTDLLGKTEKIAEASYSDYWENQVGYFESAVPGHEGHYVFGHGHDDPAHSHGHGSDNAGGGIVYAD